MCSAAELVFKGNTVFAMADPRTSKNLAKNSVCACRAESVTPTDVIAAFVVDMRMNKVGGTECTDASLSIRSGSENHNLDCSSGLDPKISYPFVAVVNVSNAVHLRLQLQSSLTEFVWIGFESNENKDVRLTCQWQNAEPAKSSKVDPASDSQKARDNEEAVSGSRANDGILIPAVIGGAVAGIILIVLLVVIILVCKKKITCPGSTKPLGAENDAPVDFDIYYSTTDDELKKLEAVQMSSARSSLSSAPDLYISPEDVRANKRRNSKKLSEISVRDLDDDGDEYVTQFEIQHKKRMSRKNQEGGDRFNPPNTDSMESSEYDRLDRRQRRPSDDVIDSYDRLGPGTFAGNKTPEMEVSISPGRDKTKKGVSNLA
ncbi:hypothetical protein Btru_005514 [Bulinus truncatus]|nr:hypothetical protein Btru_005514 [Bulinus truncatus]